MKNNNINRINNAKATSILPDKYCYIYAKYISNMYNKFNTILLYCIYNVACIELIIKKNPNATYVICDDSATCNMLKISKFINELTNAKFIFINIDNNTNQDKQFKYNLNNMKFDCIIMNPPYLRNQHLKILEKAIKLLKDDNSICINLSPVRWLQDPLAKYKKKSDYHKFEDSISKHIEELEIIDGRKANEYFNGTVFGMDIGIYKCKRQNIYQQYLTINNNRIVTKCINYIIQNNPVLETNKQDGWRVRMPLITGGKSNGSGVRKPSLCNFGKLLYFYNGKTVNGKSWWYECYMKNQYSKTTPYITLSIEFQTELHAINFIKQFETPFVKYLTDVLLGDVNISAEQIIWMHNAINPRTGLKGYESEWTNEDFYTFFNITSDERKIIEETMEKYK